jgi:hypothetical protein
MFGQSLLSAFGSAACTTDTDQLFTTNVQTTSLATYQLNNATTSIPSNTYPGTPSNITYAAGKFGNAAVFNGSSSGINLPSSLNTNVIDATGAFSISMWINANDLSTIQYLFCSNTSNNVDLGINTNSQGVGKIVWTIYNTSYSYLISTTTITTNTWYNIIVTYNNGLSELFINGASQGTITKTLLESSVEPTLGYRNTGGSVRFNGEIDQVRIFNSVLPQAAVTALYNETTTTATYPYITTEVANPNSVAYYKMSDATDQFGNYNGTATNVNFNTEGKFGFAGAFNGSSSKITIPGSPFNLTTYSLSFWIYAADYNQSGPSIVNIGLDNTGGTWGGLAFGVSANKVFYYGGDSGFFTQTGTTNITNANWVHVAMVVNGTSITGYINGTQDSGLSKTLGANITYKGGSINTIGVRQGAFGSYGWWNGNVDQIRIYDSALSAENVTTLYEEIECPAVAVTNAFNTVLYTGTGSTNPITTVGFPPDFTWVKSRNNSRSYALVDSVRGGNGSAMQILDSATTASQFLGTNYFNSLDSAGFTVSGNDTYTNNGNFVAWNWKAGGTAVSNTDGTITSQVSANVDAGFSIVKYTGNAGNGSIGHGLNNPVELVLIKKTSASESWIVWYEGAGTTNFLELNGATATQTGAGWGGVPTSSIVHLQNGGAGRSNAAANYIAYCFHSVSGFSRVGSYTWSNTSYTAGTMVAYLGFTPRFVMIKRINGAGNWQMYDSSRGATSGTQQRYALYADNSDIQNTSGYQGIGFDSDGFSAIVGADGNTTGGGGLNENGGQYLYLAIA